MERRRTTAGPRRGNRLPGPVGDGIVAGTVAGVLSGIPSTGHALATGRDPLAASEAAGSILLPGQARRAWLLAAAVAVHSGLSIGWGLVLAACLPRRKTVTWGAVAGLAIATIDLAVARGRFPRIWVLPLIPQLADHLAYGAVAGVVLARRRTGAKPARRSGPVSRHLG
jgi:hypothetical protein